MQPTIRERILACEDMKAVAGVLQNIRSSYGEPVRIAGQEDVNLLTAILSGSPAELCKGSKTAEKLLERLSDGEMGKAAIGKVAQRLVTTATRDIGTHIPKAPNPLVGTQALFERAPGRPDVIPFLCGDIEGGRRTGGSGGDAKRAQAARFLRFNVGYGNRTASLAEMMAESASFRNMLVAAGWPKAIVEEAGKAIEAKLEAGPTKEPVDPETKTILWPMPDGSYTAVSPVQAVPLWIEMRRRIKADRARPGLERRTYVIRRRSIGGTKAQNVAVEASDAGGRMDLLVTMPPRQRPLQPLDRLLYRVRSSGTSISPERPPKVAVDALRHLSRQETRSNVNTRGGQLRTLAWIAGNLFAGPLTLSRAIDGGMEFDADSLKDPIERVLVVDGVESLERDALLDLADRLAAFVSSLAEHGEDPLATFPGTVARDLCADAVVMAFAPGGFEAEAAGAEGGDGDDSEEGDEGEGEGDAEEGAESVPARPARAAKTASGGGAPKRKARR